MGVDDLRKKLAELEQEVRRELSAKATSGRPGNPGRLRDAKKTIARIKTLLSKLGVKV